MVDSTGASGDRWNATTNQPDNPGLMNAEQSKNRKHEMAYAHTGYSLWHSVVLVLEAWDFLHFASYGVGHVRTETA